MTGFWITIGLTGVAVGLLILNLKIFSKTRAERKRIDREKLADKEMVFQQNCARYELSAREVEVLRLILDGHTYKSAADTLFISEKTVDSHIRSIYFKTGVRNKLGLVNKLYQ